MIPMSDDFLSSWRKQRLARLKKQLSDESPREESEVKVLGDRDTILPLLKGRALEILETAETQYPAATARIEAELARLVREGELGGPISGEALYSLFRRLGLRVRLETKIVYLEKGQEKTFSEKLKEK